MLNSILHFIKVCIFIWTFLGKCVAQQSHNCGDLSLNNFYIWNTGRLALRSGITVANEVYPRRGYCWLKTFPNTPQDCLKYSRFCNFCRPSKGLWNRRKRVVHMNKSIQTSLHWWYSLFQRQCINAVYIIKSIKPRQNDHNIATQHVVKILVAASCPPVWPSCCEVLRHVAIRWVLLAQIWKKSIFLSNIFGCCMML